MNRAQRKLLIAALIAILALAIGATTANAASFSQTQQFDSQVTVNTDILDTHVLLVNRPNGIGRIWIRVQVGLETSLEVDTKADTTLSNLGDVDVGGSRTVKSSLDRKGAAGKEFVVKTEPFVDLDVAYDRFGERCAVDFIQTDAQLTNARGIGTCLDFAIHTGHFAPSPVKFPLLRRNGRLPYAGNDVEHDVQQGFDILDIGALVFGIPDVLVVSLDTDTTLTLNATDGYQATRQISPSGSPSTVLDQRTMHWTSGSPIDDTIQPACSWPAGQDLLYRLSNQHWGGTANVVLKPQISLRLQAPSANVNLFGDSITAGVVLYGFDLPGVTLLNQTPISVHPDDHIITTMGTLTANAPTVTTVRNHRTREGTAEAFAAAGTGANGSFDDCDAAGAGLTYRWDFGDGTGPAFGKSVSHTFDDDGTYQGSLRVSNPAGEVTTQRITTQVTNIAPGADFGIATGVLPNNALFVTLGLTNPHDPSNADTAAGFRYSFDCGNGFDAFNTVSSRQCAGVQVGDVVRGRIRDKDGGTTAYSGRVGDPGRQLDVTLSGGGTGSVASAPAGIVCPSDCGQSFATGTAVTLTATADAGSDFSGWSGDCSGTQLSCVVSMSAAHSVTATFDSSLGRFVALSVVTNVGDGTGTVTGSGISCPPDCGNSYARGASVLLTATADTGMRFDHWSGACESSIVPTCTVVMDADKTVSAVFIDIANF